MKKRLLTAWLITCMMISLVGQTPITALAEGDDSRVIPVSEGLQEVLLNNVSETPEAEDNTTVVDISEIQTENEDAIVEDQNTEITQDESTIEEAPVTLEEQDENTITGDTTVQPDDTTVETPDVQDEPIIVDDQIVQEDDATVETSETQNIQTDNTVADETVAVLTEELNDDTQIVPNETPNTQVVEETIELIEKTVDADLPQGTLNYGDIVRVSGLLPKDAIVEAIPVNVEIEGQSVLLAYDITIYENEEKKNAGISWQPDENGLFVEFISSALETVEEEVNIWHMADASETPEYVTAALSPEDSVEFVAESFSVYVVTATKLTATIVASDGNTYEINVTYTNLSGIPMDGTRLAVSELKSGDEGYDEYIEESASKVGTKTEDLEFSKVFDIKIVDENDESIEYEPTGDVDVSIRVIGVSLSEYPQVNVLHFVEDRNDENFLVYDVNSTVNGETVEFTTNSFSVYVVVGHEGGEIVTPRVEFHFIDRFTDEQYQNGITSTTPSGPYNFVNTSDDYQTTQILKSGEKLELINDPRNVSINVNGNPVEKYFFGWYVVEASSDTTTRNASTGRYSGSISFDWTSSPQRISFEDELTITPATGMKANDIVTWTLGEASGSGTIDEEGIVKVYLAPLYEDFYFLNFRKGPLDGTSNLSNNLMVRKLVIFGNGTSTEVRIGNVICESPDPTHKIFSGWEENMDGGTQYTFHKTVNHIEDSTGNLINEEADSDPGRTGYYITINKANSSVSYLDLYPKFDEARWIYFNRGATGNGSSYVGAAYRLTNDIRESGDNSEYYYFNKAFFTGDSNSQGHLSTRPGYDFGGWYVFANMDPTTGEITNLDTEQDVTVKYLDNQGNENTATIHTKAIQLVQPDGTINNVGTYSVSGNSVVHEEISGKILFSANGTHLRFFQTLNDMTLCAKWTAEEVDYTVIFWEQNANDDEYTLAAYKKLSAIAGDLVKFNATGNNGRNISFADETTAGHNVTASLQNTNSNNDYYLADLNYVHYKTYDGMDGNDNKGVVIGGDGNTIINIYYDRNLYTLRFDVGFSTNNGGSWGYQSMTDAEAQTYVGTVYGYVNGNYVELTSDGNGGWTYAGTQNVRNDYTGYRYKTTNDNNGTQYGVVNGGVVELSIGTVYSRSSGYRYQTTTSNNGTQYGIFDNSIQRVYRTNGAWRQTNNNNGTVYSGTRYTRSNANNVGNSYTNDIYYVSNGGFSLNGTGTTYGFEGTYYFPITSSEVWTYNNGANNYGNSTRYLRVTNDNTDTNYDNGFINGSMQSIIYDDAQGWYYNTTIPATVPYNGTLYKYDVSGGTNTYYVSNITNTSNYNQFLTSNQVNVGTSIPADFIPCGRRYETAGNPSTTYTIYYYDLTAKYGENILDRYPGYQPTRTNTGNTKYLFVGWIAQADSYYYNVVNSSSIKGYFETLSDNLILTGGTGNNKANYSAITAENGIAQEFRCRYTQNSTSSAKPYLYEIYFKDYETGLYPSEPTYQFPVTGGQGSTPNLQTEPTYSGYSLESAYVVTGSENGNETTPSTSYSDYSISSLGYNGMIMRYYYRPNLGTIYYYNQMASSTQTNDSEYWTCGDNTKEFYTTQYYYNQSLASADQYSDEAQALIDDGKIEGHKFVGWYTNPDGVGSPFDFSKEKMVDAGSNSSNGITLYAIYEPIKFWVKVDPNGGEINRINQSDNYYRTQLYRLGGIDVELMKDNYMQFDQYKDASSLYFPGNGNTSISQATYFDAVYGETVSEYEIPRRFVAMSDTVADQYEASGNTAYYYVNYQLRGTDGASGIYTHIRSAIYLTDEEITHYYNLYKECVNISLTQYADQNEGMVLLDESTWRSLYVSHERYRPLNSNETWTFLGWFKTEEGKDEEKMPYNFSDPTTGNFTLTAHWRLDGGYKIEYIPQYIMENGATINGVMAEWTDPVDTQLNYADGAATQIYKAPTDLSITDNDGTRIITDDSVIFRGWALVQAVYDSTNTTITRYEPVEVNSNGEITTYYYPNDAYTVSALNAGLDNTIYFQAVYQYRDSSDRRPKVTNLTLNANGGYINTTDDNDLPDWNIYPGTSCIDTNNLDANGKPIQILFGDIQSSAAVRLYKYATRDIDTQLTGGNNYFTHPENYFLLGFDEKENEEDYIATYAADSIIAVTRDDNQTLYAVWEPMVYVTFRNQTCGTVTFGLSSSDGALEVVNVKDGLYKRESLANYGEITLKSPTDPTFIEGEDVITLAIPKGAEKDITVSGTNNLGPGKVLVWNSSIDLTGDRVYSSDHSVTPGPANNTTLPDTNYSHTVGNDTHTHNLPSGEKNNLESFSFTETPISNKEPLTITFTHRDNEFALLLKDNWNGDGTGGGMQEIDYGHTDIQPDTSVNPPVKKSQDLPQTSTRFGYSFLGWAYSETATTPDFAIPGGKIDDLNNVDGGFFSENTVEINGVITRTLYGVWEPLKDAVYVHKEVPEPGNQERPFEFKLSITGKYRSGVTTHTLENVSDTFTIKNGEYLRIITTNDNGTETGHNTAYVQAEVEVYYPDDSSGTVEYKKDATRSKTVRWEMAVTPSTINGFTSELMVTVTETPVNDYTTGVTFNYAEHDNQLTVGNQTFLTSQLPVDVDTNKISWQNLDTHGTVTFKNVIDTYDVSVEKRLITNRTDSEDFPFTASYVLDEGESYEQTVDLFTASSTFLVTSGDTNTVALKDIPANAKLTVTELDDDDYATRYSTDDGANWTDGRAVVLTVDSDKELIYENTLKSYPVTFELVDQEGKPLQAMFNLSSSQGAISGASGTELYANTAGVFYTSNQFWVDTYTLNQTTTPTGYISLEGTPITIDVSGTAPYITSDNTWVTVRQVDDNDISQGFVITVKNWAQKKVTVKKVLNDVLLTTTDTYKFDFTYSYTSPIDGTTVSGNFSLQPNANTAAGRTRDLIIPANATDFTVSESTTGNVGNIYDTEDEGVWKNNGSPVAITDQNSVGSIFAIDKITDDGTITFTNTRKTVDITVVKKVNGVSMDFEFTAQLEGKAVISDYVLNKGADPNDDSDDIKTNSTGAATFILHPSNTTFEDQIVLTIPYGSKLTITETDTGNFVTTVGIGNETPTNGLSIVLLSTQTIQDLTVTFTNSEVFVAPSGYMSYTNPFVWIFMISLLLVSGTAVLVYLQKRKKEEE